MDDDLGERATVVVSTHLVEDVGAACGEVALMDGGKIVFQGTPDQLTARGEGTGAAGAAAWMGSRDGRRGLADLVTVAARPRWAAQLVTWAATAIWAVAAYLVFVGVMFAMYAYQGVGGTPPWWWVAVGATAVTAFSAVGFAIGAWWPSRFAAQPTLVATAKNGPGPEPGPATGPVYAAARRLAARPAAARHAWLAAHLAELRAGRLTLRELP
jgi:hypothetical protein